MNGAFDPGELHRRICVCFSATELRQFVEALGLAGAVGLDKSIQEMARLLVRHFERQGTLEALVIRLRQARPLMEWPEPGVLPAFPSEGPAAASFPAVGQAAPIGAMGTGTGAGAGAGAGTASGMGSGGALWPQPDTDMRILPDPYASPGGGVGSAWPGTVASPQGGQARGKGGVDPKVWLVVAGLAIVVAIVAFAIGRASTPGEVTVGAKPPSPAGAVSAGAVKTQGAAAIARDAIDRSLANMARACEIPIGRKGDLEIFERMTERCGKPLPSTQGRQEPAAPGTALPEPSQPGEPAQSPSSAAPSPAAAAAPAPAQAAGPKALPAAPNAGCLSSCDAKHRACKQGCGSEPKQSGQNNEYWACLGKCLAGNSKCKLACN